MNERAFVERRRPEWERLTSILNKARAAGLSSLSGAELQDMGKLYRRVTADLSFVSANSANEDLITYLNELAGRAHGYLFAEAPRNTMRSIINFLRRGFPILFREQAKFIGLATAISLIGALFAWIVIHTDRSAASLFLPPGYSGNEAGGPQEHMENPSPLAFSSYLMTHNIQVSLMCFAGGITFAVGTAYLLITNGLMLGAFVACPPVGLRDPLNWIAYIFPHGVFELTAIFIAGGAGLIMGWGMIAPGNLSRWDSLRKSSKTALPLMGGVVAMLIVAGFLESCVARTTLPRILKLIIAALTFIFLVGYFGFVGREPKKKVASDE